MSRAWREPARLMLCLAVFCVLGTGWALDVPPLTGEASPTPSTTPTSDNGGGNTAEAEAEPAGSNAPAIIGTAVGVVAVALLGAFLLFRRRRSRKTS